MSFSPAPFQAIHFGLIPQWSRYAQKFDQRVTPDRWKRFLVYSTRVRRLEIGTYDLHTRALDDSVFAEIARTRPTLNLFPNLIHLRILHASLRQLEHMIMFLHSNISILTINFKRVAGAASTDEINAPLDGVKRFIEEIGVRTPNLTALDIRMRFPISLVEAELCKLFRGLKSLKKLTLSPYALTSQIMSALSTLPNLGVVQYNFVEELARGQSTEVPKCTPELQQGSFPALHDLSFRCTLPDASKFLSMSFAPANLTFLHVQTMHLETAASIRASLVLLADACQLLTCLMLDLYVPLMDDAAVHAVDVVTFDEHIRPVLSFPNLTRFYFRYPRQLTLTDDDILEIATKWPSVECLCLNGVPMIDDVPYLTFASLIPFAQHCSNLRRLELYMDATARSLPTLAGRPPSVRFSCLAELRVGLAPICEVGLEQVALYLCQILPIACKLTAGIIWPYYLLERVAGINLEKEHHFRSQIWNKLSDMVLLLTEGR